jgi:hypothetical protein
LVWGANNPTGYTTNCRVCLVLLIDVITQVFGVRELIETTPLPYIEICVATNTERTEIYVLRISRKRVAGYTCGEGYLVDLMVVRPKKVGLVDVAN